MIWSQGGESKVASPSSADSHMTCDPPSKDENDIMEEEHPSHHSRLDYRREGPCSLTRRDVGGSDCAPNEKAYDVDMKAPSTACITSATEVSSRDMGGSEGVLSPVEGPTTLSRSSREDRPIGSGGAALKFFQTLQEEDTALQQGRRPLQTTGSRNKPSTSTPLSSSQKSISSVDGRARSIPRARPGGTDAGLSGEGTSIPPGGQLGGSGGGLSSVAMADSAGTMGGQQPRKLFASQSSAIGRGVRYLTHDQLEVKPYLSSWR